MKLLTSLAVILVLCADPAAVFAKAKPAAESKASEPAKASDALEAVELLTYQNALLAADNAHLQANALDRAASEISNQLRAKYKLGPDDAIARDGKIVRKPAPPKK